MVKKTGFYFCAFFISIATISCKKTQDKQPNIIFIMSDDHTSQAWGIYGGVLQDYVKNENIKRLAAKGAVLNNAFCTNSICVPSRGAILTGQFSHRNGIYTLSDFLSPDSMNIAKTLQKNNYQTAVIGKWHLIKEPSGFDHYMVLPVHGVYNDPVLKTKENWEDGRRGGKKYKGFTTDIITDYSIDWIKNRNKDKPFFLMTHFKATHEPFHYPDRHKDLYKDIEIPEPPTLYDFSPQTTGRSFVGQKLENLGNRWEQSINDSTFWTTYPGLPYPLEGLDSIQTRKAIYQKFVKDFMRCGAAIDDNIGRLLDHLEESGLDKNTVVIYTSDQGYFLGEHGFFDKRLIYEESLRMPLVVCYPKEINGGTRINDIVLNIDFPALFADYAGLDKPEFIQGRSFRENLIGNTPEDWRKVAYYRYWHHRLERPAHFGIRNDRYKLAFFYGQPLGMRGAMKKTTDPAWEFYDLLEDPREISNAYNNPEYADIIKDMKEELKRQQALTGEKDHERPVMVKIFEDYWD